MLSSMNTMAMSLLEQCGHYGLILRDGRWTKPLAHDAVSLGARVDQHVAAPHLCGYCTQGPASGKDIETPITLAG
jgi:hypothetical protein